MIEDGDPAVYAELPLLFNKTGNAHLIGITGPPGSGKSTIAGRLANFLSNTGQKVAVIAVDPSSIRSGGVILGDRARMRTAEAAGKRVYSFDGQQRKSGKYLQHRTRC